MSLDRFKHDRRREYEVKESLAGTRGVTDVKEGGVLNRFAKREVDGLAHDADPRQQEKLVHEPGLESARAWSTRCAKPTGEVAVTDLKLPEPWRTTPESWMARASLPSQGAVKIH